MTSRSPFTALLLISLFSIPSTMAETLRVLNWSDYIDESVLESFTEATGAEIDYVTFGNENDFIDEYFGSAEPFDVIVPSDNLLEFLISRDLLTPINKASIDQIENLDPAVMSQLSEKDPGNQFAIPYLWGTTGLGLNTTVAPANADALLQEHGWGVVFDPELRRSFSSCGIAAVYERDEIFAASLRYLGYSINTSDPSAIAEASDLIAGLISDVRYLHAERYLEDLADGSICLAIGYSGDIVTASYEVDPGELSYYIPSQGASLWFDVFAIPAASEHKALAHEFINHFTQPQNAASNTNYNAYPNPLLNSVAMVDQDILSDPAIYPAPNTMAMLEAFSVSDKKARRLKKKYWVKATCSGSGFCEVPMDIGY